MQDQTPEPNAEMPSGSRAPEPAGRKILRTGAYLHTSCPVCNGDLVDEGWIRFRVIASGGNEGELRLSPRFNVFDKESTIALAAGEKVQDFRCPRCGCSLMVPEHVCGVCRSPAVRVRVAVVHLEISLYICSRIGCHWHDISDEDRRRLVLDNAD